MTTSMAWPPIRAVRRVLAAARRRCQAMPITERPASHCPTSVLGLFTANELLILAQSGYYPLPARAVAYIAVKQGYVRRDRHRIARVVRRVLATDLRDALAVLKGSRQP